MRKKFADVILLLVAVVLFVPNNINAKTAPIRADDFEVDGIYYKIIDTIAQTVRVTYSGYYSSSCDEYQGDVFIPETVTYSGITYSVTEIGYSAFEGCTDLISVTIPNSVTSISPSAFYDCAGLVSIMVDAGNSVYDSRENCNAIIETASNTLIVGCKNTIIPNSVTTIGDSAFGGCVGLTSVTIPNSVTSIGGTAFSDCTGLTSVTIPNSVTSIGGSAFSGCVGLTSVTIPNSVTSIGSGAFKRCASLTSVTIGNLVTSIGESVFYGCAGLTEVNISDLSAWCKMDFEDYYSNPLSYAGKLKLNGEDIANLVIPSDIAEIKNYAFNGCVGLTSVTIPNSVTTIGDSAFRNCTGLTSVTIPNSVTSIDNYAFYGCAGLTSITIPNSVTTIGDYAFSDCTGLTSITIPNSVTTIGDSAFRDCTGLTSITIPNSVTTIGDSAFRDCTGLTSVTIPNSVTEIGSYAFCNTGWYNNQLDGVLYLDNCCLGYKGDEPTGSLSINSGTRLIADAAFKSCSGLDGIFIPNSVARIGGEAFWYSGLETVHFEDGEIPVSLGYGISGNKRPITIITKSVSTTGTVVYCGIFEGNPLKSVYIGRDIVSDEMEAKPFGYFNDLNSVVFGKKVTTIENGAFEGNSAISSVTSLNIIPPVCLSDSTFDDAVYKNATLYVPKASIGRYATADVWNKFESVAVSGVESVKNDSYNSVEVARYDVHGRLLSAPTQGINIVIYSDGTTRKEFVK